jgi:hypothetical protein
VLAAAVAVAVISAVISAVMSAGTTPAAADGGVVQYTPPVDAPVVDPYRPPATPFGAGNRGIDLGTAPGAVVRAAAPGTVTFAGRIGPSTHVVVLHADGLRTSYSFLAHAAVHRGQAVAGGEEVGIAGGPLHFGVRDGDRYLDPTPFLDPGPSRVVLVPHDDVRPGTIAQERRGLVRALGSALLRGAGGAVVVAGTAVDWARQAGSVTVAAIGSELAALGGDLRVALHYAVELQEVVRLWRIGWAMARWASTECTPRLVDPPPLDERRIVVLVAGLGSSSQTASVGAVDTGTLGYAPGDVVRFSYDPEHAGYEAADTTVDLARSAAALRSTLQEIRVRTPGVPVDVIAHSQGGVVARLALGSEGDHLDPRLPPIRTLVTLGSPHRGADAATAADALDASLLGGGLLDGADAAGPLRDLIGPSMFQLSETSGVVRGLVDRPLPPGANVTSIAAHGDLVVAAPNTSLPGARHAVVALIGPSAHRRLPGHPAAHREIALAVAGLPPTCRPFLDALHHTVTGEAISLVTDRLGAGLALGAFRSSGRLPLHSPPGSDPPTRH